MCIYLLSGEPLKKKKRMDVSVIIEREKKKKKKLEKEMTKLEKKGRLLKPIEEIEGDRAVIKTKRYLFLCVNAVILISDKD